MVIVRNTVIKNFNLYQILETIQITNNYKEKLNPLLNHQAVLHLRVVVVHKNLDVKEVEKTSINNLTNIKNKIDSIQTIDKREKLIIKNQSMKEDNIVKKLVIITNIKRITEMEN
jgi:hypothetical protein